MFCGRCWGSEEQVEQETYVKRCFGTTLSSSLIPDLKVHLSQFVWLQNFNEWQKLSILNFADKSNNVNSQCVKLQHLHNCTFCWEGFSFFEQTSWCRWSQKMNHFCRFHLFYIPITFSHHHDNNYPTCTPLFLVFVSSHNNSHTISANSFKFAIIRNWFDWLCRLFKC